MALRDLRPSAGIVDLARHDEVLGALVARYGVPPTARPTPVPARFGALVRAICYQQLAGRAASSIHGRVVEALGSEVTAERILAIDSATLSACGLSGSKVASILDLAGHVASGQVSFARIGRLSDEELVSHLTRVRGIGRWTAEMFLIFDLARPDVWPTGDFGVRVGFASAWGLPDVPNAAQLADAADAYRPFRSSIAWYCWRVADERSAAKRVGTVKALS